MRTTCHVKLVSVAANMHTVVITARTLRVAAICRGVNNPGDMLAAAVVASFLPQDDVIQALRGTSKQMQRATASLKSPRAGRTPPQSPRASSMDDPRLAAAAAALLAASNSPMDAAPRRFSAFGGAGTGAAAAGSGLAPRAAAVAAGLRMSQMSHLAGGDESAGDDVMYDQDDVMDDEEMSARAQEVLRRADRVTNRGGRNRPKSALEVMVAAAAESDGGEDGKEAELVDLLAAGVGKAGRGRGAKVGSNYECMLPCAVVIAVAVLFGGSCSMR